MTDLPRLLLQLLQLQSSLEESQLNEKQLKHQLEVQSESLNNKVEELRALSEHAHTSITSEMVGVEAKVAELESIKVSRSHAEAERQLQMTHLLLLTGAALRSILITLSTRCSVSTSLRSPAVCARPQRSQLYFVCHPLGGAGADTAAGHLQGAATGADQQESAALPRAKDGGEGGQREGSGVLLQRLGGEHSACCS